MNPSPGHYTRYTLVFIYKSNKKIIRNVFLSITHLQNNFWKTKIILLEKLVNSQGYESKSLLDSQDFYSGSSTSLTSNQNFFGSFNAAKFSAIKTGELTLNSTLLEFFF